MSEKKTVLLRLSHMLWKDLSKWSEEEFRSINGQIEYLLTDAVNKRKKGSKEVKKKVEEPSPKDDDF